jgi:hypothetical protein
MKKLIYKNNLNLNLKNYIPQSWKLKSEKNKTQNCQATSPQESRVKKKIHKD